MRYEDSHPLAETELRLGRALLALQSVIGAADGRLDAAMAAVLDGALMMVPAADGALIATDEDGDLICRAAAGTLETLAGRRLNGVTHLAERTLSEGRYLYSPDVTVDDHFAPIIVRSGARSIASVPIPFRDGHVGVLKVSATRPDAFNGEHQLAIRLLAGPLALAFLGSAHLEASEGEQSANRRFAATFEQAAVGMAHVGPDGGFLRVNQRFCEIAGYTEDELLTGGFQQITHREDLAIDERLVGELIEGLIDRYTLEKRYIRADATVVWVNLTVSLVHNPDGSPEFFVAVIEDISARKHAEQAARHDSLTGLLNRRGLIEELDHLLLPSRDGDPFVLAFLDMDGFKAINDRLGHAEGDRCLVAIADGLGSVIRRGDRLIRLGGDEFVMILPRETGESARHLIDRACKAVAAATRDCGLPITVSAGAVTVPHGTHCSAAEIIAAADSLMYRAKRTSHQGPLIEMFVPSAA